jgi:hypothetical protein
MIEVLMTSLFDPIRLGAVVAPNRILMAPLTRARSTKDHVPTPMMIDYYRQRAGAGLNGQRLVAEDRTCRGNGDHAPDVEIVVCARVNRANDEDDFARRWQPNTFHGNDGTHRPVAIS